MLEFFSSLTAAHAALFVSILALLVSLRSVSIAEKSRRATERRDRETERARVFEKRTELLAEIDRQNARFGTLIMITAQKLLLLQKNADAAKQNEKEYQRLKQNLEAIETLRSRYEEQRQASEKIDEHSRVADLDPVLADIRRLTIHVDEDIEKESRGLEELRATLALLKKAYICHPADARNSGVVLCWLGLRAPLMAGVGRLAEAHAQHQRPAYAGRRSPRTPQHWREPLSSPIVRAGHCRGQ